MGGILSHATSDDAFAQGRGEIVHRGDDDGDRQHLHAGGAIVQQVDVLEEQEADPVVGI